MPATIRPMTPGDVEPAAAAILAGDWGERTLFLRFVTAEPHCRPFVAEADGAIIGTGVGTANGPVGWVGTVFVAQPHRGRGLGAALTGAVTEALEAAGCRTLVLVATEAGRPLYERLGFELQSSYRTIEATGLERSAAPDVIRPATTDDLDAITALDRAATGEDRSHILRAFIGPDSTRCLDGPDGALRGFVMRAPWGGGATIAPHVDDAVSILEYRRRIAGPGRRVRAGVLAENQQGLRRLEALGWHDAWTAPRLARGEDLHWQPDSIWGQFNHALG